MRELNVDLTGNILTVSQFGYPTNVFQLVDKIPLGYMIWNIGTNMPKGYLPLCRLASRQPFEGARNIDPDTLKAIKIEGAELVLAAIGNGQNTVAEMEKFLAKNQDPEPGTWTYEQVKRIQAALPVLRKVDGR